MLVAQLCLTLCNPMNCSPPGSSVHEILQARILEWVSSPFSRGSSQRRDQTRILCAAGRFFSSWATREALKPKTNFLTEGWRNRTQPLLPTPKSVLRVPQQCSQHPRDHFLNQCPHDDILSTFQAWWPWPDYPPSALTMLATQSQFQGLV